MVNSKFTEEERLNAILLYSKGHTVKQVEELTGISSEYVKDLLKKYNVSARPSGFQQGNPSRAGKPHSEESKNKISEKHKESGYTKSSDEFIQEAKLLHQNKYDYSKLIYINDNTPLEIICSEHGSFWQRAGVHLRGSSCRQCSLSQVSKLEIKWLDKLNILNEYRQKSIRINNKIYKVDAYNPTTNIVYEFYGDFWHGNPRKYQPSDINCFSKKSFGDLFTKTIDRERIISEAGFILISIWEYDFG